MNPETPISSEMPLTALKMWPSMIQAVKSDKEKDHAMDFCNLLDKTLDELTHIHSVVERRTQLEELQQQQSGNTESSGGTSRGDEGRKRARMKFTPKRQETPRS
ncbi:hypothetical protein BIW11_07485 [Tropilaelaps mercedesae]|uniref:Uncharacterized protein n=1 Tax=Tropilaelaps mercedesae TaxID=418985 RepID=A0A1V9XTQ7_9ACAR|nr:hypothetical protein BIW11_07485 [Tropilaelaps mercedesae]